MPKVTDADKLVQALERGYRTGEPECFAEALPLVRQLIEERDSIRLVMWEMQDKVTELREENERLKSKPKLRPREWLREQCTWEGCNRFGTWDSPAGPMCSLHHPAGRVHIADLQSRLSAAEAALKEQDELVEAQAAAQIRKALVGKFRAEDRLRRAQEVVEAAKKEAPLWLRERIREWEEGCDPSPS